MILPIFARLLTGRAVLACPVGRKNIVKQLVIFNYHYGRRNTESS